MSLVRAAGAHAKMYFDLSKFRLSSLVVLSTAGGYVMVAGPTVTMAGAALVCGGTFLCSAAANTFNQMYEKRTDGLMARTLNRPLPSGKMSLTHAAAFGGTAALAGTALLATTVNPVTAALGAANIVLYSCVYTPLKQKTTWNTTIGAVVGAIPPVMGYVAAAGGSTLASSMEALMSPESVMLGSLLFAWQMPHFYSLAWYQRRDYARGGHMMLPIVDATGEKSANLILGYSAALAAFPAVSMAVGVTDWVGLLAILPGLALTARAVEFKDERTDSNARKVFKMSLAHLVFALGFLAWSGYRVSKKKLSAEETKALLMDTSAHGAGVAAVAGAAARPDAAHKCPFTHVSGHQSTCMHEAIRQTGVTPTCNEVKEAAEVVTGVVQATVAPQTPAVSAHANK